MGGAHQNNRMMVTGAGYVISLPTSTQTPPLLPANSTIELITAQGAGPVDVCPSGSTSVFTANSGAPLIPGLCPSGQSGVVLWNGLSLTITTDASNNYQARLQSPQPAAVNPQAYFVSPNGNDSNPGTLTLPF